MSRKKIYKKRVNADEIQGTAFTRNRTSGITAKEVGEVGTVQNEGTEPTKQGNLEDPTEETRNGKGIEEKAGNPTGFIKHDNDIQVTNPMVTLNI